MDMKVIQENSYNIAKAHGFHEVANAKTDHVLAGYLPFVCRLTEEIEAVRKGKDPARGAGHVAVRFDWVEYFKDMRAVPSDTTRRHRLAKAVLIMSEVGELAIGMLSNEVPEGSTADTVEEYLEDELSDIVIRSADLAGLLGLDLDRGIVRKLEINRNRKHMHGGKQA